MVTPFGPGKVSKVTPTFGKGKRNAGMSFKPKSEKISKAIKTPRVTSTNGGNPY